jgi:Neuraminidase (sialidase)
MRALPALIAILALSSLSFADSANESAGCAYEVFPPNPPNEGTLFVDHSQAGRSGHLGHALVEYEDGKILAFYPNCSGDNKGHSAVGWMEYKRSKDGGKTWGEPIVLAYSKNLFDEGQASELAAKKRSAFAEKAILTDDGEIVLFFLVCDISTETVWTDFQMPTYIISSDGGYTWSEPYELCDTRGRVYDARYYKGEILALFFANDKFLGKTDEHVYELYASSDGGRTFEKRSVLPFDTTGRSYGTVGMLDSGRIVVYIYNVNDEHNADYLASDDGGRIWSDVKTAHFAKKLRNPQMASVNGCYFMHGRSGSKAKKGEEKGHMVLYSSRDGLTWDDGVYLRMREAGLGAYSNSIVVGLVKPDKRRRLLIQASHAYEKNKTNVLHWWIDIPTSE